eukprot:jgi/Ulvmu1/12611/UM093_0003.1
MSCPIDFIRRRLTQGRLGARAGPWYCCMHMSAATALCMQRYVRDTYYVAVAARHWISWSSVQRELMIPGQIWEICMEMGILGPAMVIAIGRIESCHGDNCHAVQPTL